MSKPDPAFPQPNGYGSPMHAGMSLRDYFAAQALMGFLAHEHTDITSDTIFEGAALVSYQFADAMLAERAKP